MLSTPRRRLGFTLVVVASIAAVIVSALWWDSQNDVRRENLCKAQVASREDNRTMWEYLIDTNPDAPEAQLEAFTKALDNRLPVLICEEGSAVPVEVTPTEGAPSEHPQSSPQ
jgi:hypothetical protein